MGRRRDECEILRAQLAEAQECCAELAKEAAESRRMQAVRVGERAAAEERTELALSMLRRTQGELWRSKSAQAALEQRLHDTQLANQGLCEAERRAAGLMWSRLELAGRFQAREVVR